MVHIHSRNLSTLRESRGHRAQGLMGVSHVSEPPKLWGLLGKSSHLLKFLTKWRWAEAVWQQSPWREGDSISLCSPPDLTLLDTTVYVRDDCLLSLLPVCFSHIGSSHWSVWPMHLGIIISTAFFVPLSSSCRKQWEDWGANWWVLESWCPTRPTEPLAGTSVTSASSTTCGWSYSLTHRAVKSPKE